MKQYISSGINMRWQSVPKIWWIKNWEQKMFHSSKSLINVSNVNIDKIAISEGFPFAKKGTKNFRGYRSNEEVTLLCVFLLKLILYIKHFDNLKTKSSFFVEKMQLNMSKIKEITSRKKTQIK